MDIILSPGRTAWWNTRISEIDGGGNEMVGRKRLLAGKGILAGLLAIALAGTSIAMCDAEIRAECRENYDYDVREAGVVILRYRGTGGEVIIPYSC